MAFVVCSGDFSPSETSMHNRPTPVLQSRCRALASLRITSCILDGVLSKGVAEGGMNAATSPNAMPTAATVAINPIVRMRPCLQQVHEKMAWSCVWLVNTRPSTLAQAQYRVEYSSSSPETCHQHSTIHPIIQHAHVRRKPDSLHCRPPIAWRTNTSCMPLALLSARHAF